MKALAQHFQMSTKGMVTMEFPHQEGPLKLAGGEGALVCTTANGTLTLRHCWDTEQQRALPGNYVLQLAETSSPKVRTGTTRDEKFHVAIRCHFSLGLLHSTGNLNVSVSNKWSPFSM